MTHTKYRADVDGLRAIAVLAVIGFHGFPDRISGGFIGVDVFFVISGFLISGIILCALDAGTFSYRNFYARRIRRIFPALVVVLLALIVLGWFVLLPDEYVQLGRHVVAAALFSSNFLLWNEVGYFDLRAELKPLLHLWSLGIEEQFYLLWPITLVAIFRSRHRVALVAGLALASFLLNLYLVRDYPAAAFYLPFTRFWELLIGALLAIAAQRGDVLTTLAGKLPSRFRQPDIGVARNVVSVAGAILITVSVAFFGKGLAFPGWPALVPTAGAAMLIAAGPSAWLNKHLLAYPIVVYIGLISYPLYLWHWPLLSFLRLFQDRLDRFHFVAAEIAVLLLSFALSAFTYRFVETPIRRGWDQGGFTIRLITATAATAVIATIIFIGERGEGRVPVADVRTLVVGDSHARALSLGFPSQETLYVGDGACFPGMGLDAVNTLIKGSSFSVCTVYDDLPRLISTYPRLQRIVFSARGQMYIEGNGFGIDARSYSWKFRYLGKEGESSELLQISLRETLRKLTSKGVPIFFVLPVPELGFEPTECVQLRLIDKWIPLRSPCSVDRQLVDKRQERYRRAVREVLTDFPSVAILDPIDALCDEKACYAMKGALMLYEDDDHLNAEGSKYFLSRVNLIPLPSAASRVP